MIPSSGGPVRVKKSSGRSNYHSSVFHNVRSLPLPNWSGSFQLSAKDARLKKGERAKIKYIKPVSSSVSVRRRFRKRSTNSPTTRMATTIAATSVTPIAITDFTATSYLTTTTFHTVTQQPQPPSSPVTTVVNGRRIDAKWPVKHNYSKYYVHINCTTIMIEGEVIVEGFIRSTMPEAGFDLLGPCHTLTF
uniref:Uncharacterized protein n=1 Tax=Eptatretus burgeri TaxID=7764 RepID=A0A8C4Q342_EPTBU